MRLSTAAAGRLPPEVERFDYDRAVQAAGIVHFGIGAFHRAHQAWYTDRAMSAGDRDWMIAGVSLRSGDVAAQMNPQDGLYTLTERSAGMTRVRLIGAVNRVHVAAYERAAIAATLRAPGTKIVSFTITEKGYCRAPDGSLDPARADSGSVFAVLAEGLQLRRKAGLAGVTLLSCDNLADNGQVLGRLLMQYCERTDSELGEWIAANCTFPATMVDRIVPATTAADREQVAQTVGLDDEAAVVTEPFSQWVIEDRFAGARPSWEQVGAQLVDDVAPYETAKLRMLNGAHSALAYLGLRRGHMYVHEAVTDPALRPVVERLMVREAATSFAAAAGQDLEGYAAALIKRFANPALNHRLGQIAMDGSQKVPQRWLATLAAQQSAGETCEAILTALGAWLRHVRGDNGPVDDPMAAQLQSAWDRAGDEGIVAALFDEGGLLSSEWRPSDGERDAVLRSMRSA